MKVSVKYIALYRDLAGTSEEIIELPGESSVRDLLEAVALKHHALGEYLGSGEAVVLVDGKAAQMSDRLRDGCEVVVMPPISGGSNYGFVEKIDPAKYLEAFLSGLSDDVGAVAVFIGRVKSVIDDKQVENLEYEVLEPHSTEALASIGEEEARKHALRSVCIYHKKGSALPGEPVLFIAVASRGRREALAALEEILERVKHEAFVWKLERREDGEYWILGDSRRVPRGRAP
ncbi:MAG: molybdenum cofactor biosynthesis protein MoaE [Thermofilum sp.]